VLIVLNVIALLYSGTRGTMIGLFVGAFVTLLIMSWKARGHMRKVLFGTVIAMVVLIPSIFIFKDSTLIKSSSILSRIASISPNDITGASRLSMWKISYEAWKERPILGYGQDNFSYIFARKFIPEKMCNLEPWYDRSHDVFFDWLVAAGSLGLITYLSLYGVTLWSIWKKKNAMPLSEKAILIFVFDNLTSYILFFAVLAYITVRTNEELVHKGNPLFSSDQMNLLVIPVIGIVLVITQYYINYRPLTVNRLVIRAMSVGEYAKIMPFTDAVKMEQTSFTDAIAMNTLGSEEAREQFLQMAIRMGQIKVPDDLAAGDKQAMAQAINNIIQAARKDAVTSYPSYKDDVRMLSIYGMFFNGVGDSPTAEEVLKAALALAPNKQLISFELIRAYLIQKKFGDAYATGRKTYDLSITCNDAMKWYMMSAAYDGQYKDAAAYVASKGQNVGLDPDVIGGVIASGQISVAIEILQEAKKANPAMGPQIDAYIKQLLLAPKR
jgi:hypothetical protein